MMIAFNCLAKLVSGEPALPPITVEMLHRVLNSYPVSAGMGIDTVNPRSWRFLPVDTKVKLIQLMHALEESPISRKELVILMVFLDKIGGGQRPIALILALFRVWSRMRAAEVQKWERENDEPFFCGERGRRCETAAYLHNLVAKWANTGAWLWPLWRQT